MKERILIVDDERDICEILSFKLENDGYTVETAESAEEALEKLTPDCSLILLDVMMRGMSGYRLAEKLRKAGNSIPIIFLTAKDTENDMLTGFAVGGDDYISKPFSLNEVSARVRAVLKRTSGGGEETDGMVEAGGLKVDSGAKELIIDGETVPLTRTEFEIVALLASNPARVFSREEIIDRIWKDSPYVTERTVDVHINRLRKKMGEKGAAITSRPGYGYRFNNEE